jgi:hypothetical protein
MGGVLNRERRSSLDLLCRAGVADLILHAKADVNAADYTHVMTSYLGRYCVCIYLTSFRPNRPLPPLPSLVPRSPSPFPLPTVGNPRSTGDASYFISAGVDLGKGGR